MLAKDIMTTKLISVTPQASIREAAVLMNRHNISGMPVVTKDNKLVGVISESDIIDIKNQNNKLDHWINIESFLTRSPGGSGDADYDLEAMGAYLDEPVEEVMSVNLLTANPESPVKEIAKTMVHNKINRIPIVDNNRLVGIITRGDVLKAISLKL